MIHVCQAQSPYSGAGYRGSNPWGAANFLKRLHFSGFWRPGADFTTTYPQFGRKKGRNGVFHAKSAYF